MDSNGQEISVRLLQNGRYVWNITLNEPPQVTPLEISTKLKNIDKALKESFPNHVKENSVRFKELED